MYCVFCGNPIPIHLEGERVQLIGKGREYKTKKEFGFTLTLCSECSYKIDKNLEEGEEGALRREFERSLWDDGLSQEEIALKVKDFSTKTFGKEGLEGVFGK